MSRRMSPADAAWFLGENAKNPMMISSIIWLDKTPDVRRLKELYRERILERHPVFQQRIVPSAVRVLLPSWEDDPDFDLDEHIVVEPLPAPGDQRTLERVCGEQRSTPLPHDRPLWQVHVFTGYRGHGCAMHVRVHHSIGDGLALMALLLTLADEFESGSIPIADSDHTGLGRELLHRTEQAARTASRLAVRPTALVRAARRSLVNAAWGAKLLTPILAERTALIGRPSGEKRMAWDPEGLPLRAIKGTGRQYDATVNDVLLTLLSGALHRYLMENDSSAENVLVMVPVNLRPPGQALPRHLGNQIGLLPVELPVGPATPEERLTDVQARLAELKDSPAPAVSRVLLASTSLLTPPVERAIHRINQVRSTGVVTNVPGPAQPLHIAGAEIHGVIGWGGMTAHLNLSVAFVSLAGRVFTGMVTDAGITPDPERILEHFHDEWVAMPGRVAA